VIFSRIRRHRVVLSPYHLVTWVVIGALILALALLPLQIVAPILGWGLAIALALIDPAFGLFWAVLSVPLQDMAQLPGGLSYTQAAMLLAVGAWALRALAHPERPIARGRLLPLWAALLWTLLLAAALTPYSRVEGLKETLRWAEAFLVWLLVVNTIRRPWHVAGLVACLLLAPAADAAIGLAQFASGDGPPSFRIAGSPFVRAYGTIGAPNSFAGYLNMAWPLALAIAVVATWWAWRHKTTDGRRTTYDGLLFVVRRSSFVRWCIAVSLWLIAILQLAALLASFSRGGWLGAAAGLLALILSLGRRVVRWALPALVAAALLLTLGGVGLLPGPVGARLASIMRSVSIFDAGSVQVTGENFAVVERMAQMQAGWRMFVAHPLTGVGPGNYSLAYSDFAVFPWYASRGHAHNYYLHMAAEAGVAGALAYLMLLAGVSLQAPAALRRADSPLQRGVAIGCCGIIAAVAAHDLFENLHVLSMGIQLAAVWGLLTESAAHSRNDKMTG
jgi:O-antigen ligase